MGTMMALRAHARGGPGQPGEQWAGTSRDRKSANVSRRTISRDAPSAQQTTAGRRAPL
jgi:hypothetical protein